MAASWIIHECGGAPFVSAPEGGVSGEGAGCLFFWWFDDVFRLFLRFLLPIQYIREVLVRKVAKETDHVGQVVHCLAEVFECPALFVHV